MVDDERPSRPARGRASWTGTHRSGAARIGAGRADRARPAAARERPPPEPDDDIDATDQHDWLDHEAGPVVRPYTLTGGRSRPITGRLSLLTHVEALYAPEANLVGLQPEHRVILSITRTALSLAEIAARLDLPVGVVRVLVGDLLQASLVSTFESDTTINPPDENVLQAVIDGLRSL
jgi:DNA-directed RNA polymerase specialized sigma24 family protein